MEIALQAESESQQQDGEKKSENVIINLSRKGKEKTTVNSFDKFWLRVWAVICSIVSTIAVVINKGIKFVFRKPAPLKYVKAGVALVLIVSLVILVSAPFNITVNKEETLNLFESNLLAVEKLVGVDKETNTPIYKWGFINKKGVEKIPFIYNGAFDFKYGVAWVHVVNIDGARLEDYWQLINKSGKAVGSIKIDSYYNDEIPVSQFGDKVKLARVKHGGQYGYVSTKGQWAIMNEFADAGDFIDKLARVRVGSDTHFINSKKKQVGGTYALARDFCNGYAAVKSNSGKWGFIDAKGSEVKLPQYEAVSDFKMGYALVLRGNTYGIIDKTFKEVVPASQYSDMQLREFFDMK
ncbi:MAG: WG repeat-containing protein [Clostridia bacterium]